VVLFFYFVLVTVPAFLPLPPQGASVLDNLTLFAQFAFWGIWWPFAILSMMLVGRVWCGVLCPEGFLSEQASRIGFGFAPPRWMKWGGWPFVAFITTTVYGQLLSVYEYPKATLLILGGSTLAAVVVGLLWGRGKRVWCRYLCPANGVFGLLARVAPIHFAVDAVAWKRPDGDTAVSRIPVNCAPMLNLRVKSGNAGCHMCGRCSGHRNAMWLSARTPASEIVALDTREANRWEVHLLIFGLIGVAMGAFQWSASPWFVKAKLAAGGWLLAQGHTELLSDAIPWWVLTHYPEANDVFTWLDGAMILFYIGATALLVGGWIMLWLQAAARILGVADGHLRLAYGLTPLAGIGAFLGLSALTLTLLAAEGVRVPAVAWLRGGLLAIAIVGSLWLGARLIASMNASDARRIAGGLAYAVATSAGIVPWIFLFYIW